MKLKIVEADSGTLVYMNNNPSIFPYTNVDIVKETVSLILLHTR